MLRQQQAEELNGSRNVSLRSDTAQTRKSLSRAAAEDVLETATLLQSAEQDRLSIAEIEALAAKRGLTDKHVRQALAMHGHAGAQARLPRVRLTRTQWRVSAALVLLYWLQTVLVACLVPFGSTSIMEYLLPLLLCFGLGFYLRYKRAGIAAGVAVTGVLLLGLGISYAVRQQQIIDNGDLFLQILELFFVVMVLVSTGAVGAILRQWATKRQMPYEPTILRVSDLDR